MCLWSTQIIRNIVILERETKDDKQRTEKEGDRFPKRKNTENTEK